MTLQQRHHHIHTVNGITFWDEYQAADMTKIHVVGTNNNYTLPAYYSLVNGAMVQLTTAQVVEDPHQKTTNTQYYWKPTGTAKSTTENPVYEYISKRELADSSESDSKFANTSSTLYTYNPNTDQYVIAAFGNNFVGSGLTWYDGDVPSGSDGKLYYIKDYNAIEIHAPVPSDNKLATTEWTVAYVKDKIDLLSRSIGNKAGGSGDDVDLSSLKSDIKYSDFETLYWNYVKNNYVAGSAAYRTAYSDAYDDFVNEQPLTYQVNGTNYTLSDYSNTIRYRLDSAKINNITQTDGIVHATIEELPTDTAEVEVNIWGAEDSDSKFGYSIIESVDTDSSLLQTLFKWQNTHSVTGPSNQIFVIDGVTYYKLPTSHNLSNGETYYFINDNGAHEVYNPLVDPITNYHDPSLKSWKQLYIQGPKYVELDLSNAQTTTNTVTANDANELKFNNKYVISKANDGTITVVSGNAYTPISGSLSVTSAELEAVYYRLLVFLIPLIAHLCRLLFFQ